jgi:hypothetical protein
MAWLAVNGDLIAVPQCFGDLVFLGSELNRGLLGRWRAEVLRFLILVALIVLIALVVLIARRICEDRLAVIIYSDDRNDGVTCHHPPEPRAY